MMFKCSQCEATYNMEVNEHSQDTVRFIPSGWYETEDGDYLCKKCRVPIERAVILRIRKEPEGHGVIFMEGHGDPVAIGLVERKHMETAERAEFIERALEYANERIAKVLAGPV